MQPTDVLIIDDSKVITKITTKALLLNKIDGYAFDVEHIHIAYDGMEAFEFLGSHPEISLVIADVMIPRLTGEELIDRLIDTNRISSLDVIFMSTQVNKGSIHKKSLEHIQGVIYKPFNDETFSESFNQISQNAKIKLDETKEIKQNHSQQTQYLNSWISDYLQKESLELKTDILEPMINLEFEHNNVVNNDEFFMLFNSVLDSYIFEIDETHQLNLPLIKNIYDRWREPEKFQDLGVVSEFDKIITAAKNSLSEKSTLEDIRFIFILPINHLLNKTKKRINTQDKYTYEDFMPYFDDLLEVFTSIDINYQATETKLILQHIQELQSLQEKVKELYNKDKISKYFEKIAKSSENINAIYEHIKMSLRYIKLQIIPFYIHKANSTAWQKAKKSPTIAKHLKSYLKDQMFNTHNLLCNKKIISPEDMKQFHKYDIEKVILLSKNLDTLDLFKNELAKKLPYLDIFLYTKNSILKRALEKETYCKVVIDLDYHDSIFQNGLLITKALLKHHKKIKSLAENSCLYILVSQEQLPSISMYQDKLNYKIILKPLTKANIFDKFYLGS
ncbi:response regulator [Sulfurimonas sp.]|nr:response regulator [Sulfurimonas sp.]